MPGCTPFPRLETHPGLAGKGGLAGLSLVLLEEGYSSPPGVEHPKMWGPQPSALWVKQASGKFHSVLYLSQETLL